MDYEKKYKNALEWARQVINGECGFIRMDVEEVFPELKESEDEKIRKDVLAFIRRKGQHIDKYKWHKWIAWLEKQGEQNYEFNGIAESRPAKGTLKKLADEIKNKESEETFGDVEQKVFDELLNNSEQLWSEEDEVMCQETIDWFEQKCFPYALEEENPARKSIQWLKSLKQRLNK